MERKAFTLVELLVVISIIALLVALLLPTLAKARESAQTALCLANQRSCGQGFKSYASDFSNKITAYRSENITGIGNKDYPWSYFLAGEYTYNEEPIVAYYAGSSLIPRPVPMTIVSNQVTASDSPYLVRKATRCPSTKANADVNPTAGLTVRNAFGVFAASSNYVSKGPYSWDGYTGSGFPKPGFLIDEKTTVQTWGSTTSSAIYMVDAIPRASEFMLLIDSLSSTGFSSAYVQTTSPTVDVTWHNTNFNTRPLPYTAHNDAFNTLFVDGHAEAMAASGGAGLANSFSIYRDKYMNKQKNN